MSMTSAQETCQKESIYGAVFTFGAYNESRCEASMRVLATFFWDQSWG